MKLRRGPALVIFVSLFAVASLPPIVEANTVTVDPYGMVHTIGGREVLGKSDNQGKGPESSRSESSENNPGKGNESKETPKPQEAQSDTEQGHGRGVLRLTPSGKTFSVTTDEEGEETPEGTDSGEVVVNPPENQDDIVIRASGSASLVIRNKIFAQTHFPLMVNLETNELMVTTPKGTKIVTVLPDSAVEHMLAANVLDQLGGKGGLLWLANQATPSATPIATPSAEPSPTEEATPSGSPTETPTPVESAQSQTGEQIVLTENADGTLVYRIPGFKNKKFLGLGSVILRRTAIVSAQTGELLSIEEDFFTRILDVLSR